MVKIKSSNAFKKYLEEEETTKLFFRINEFDGPLDLLLLLIKEKKMDILDINLSEIADQYIGILMQDVNINLDEASEYFLIASKLLAIKTRQIVDLQNREELIIDSDEENLIETLLKYEQVKKASQEIAKIFDEVKIMDKIDDDLEQFLKQHKNLENVVYKNKQEELARELEKIILQGKKINEPIPTIRRRKISIEEVMKGILDEVQVKKSVSFKKLIKGKDNFLIAYLFLAILELTSKKKVITIEKKKDIIIKRHE